jgi:hypothetical protein
MDFMALLALKHSALALDIYTWLAHRLCRIKRPQGSMLNWTNLRKQFGQEYRNPKDFKREFRAALRQVWLVYPFANIDEFIGGIVLRPSPPPISRTTMTVPIHNTWRSRIHQSTSTYRSGSTSFERGTIVTGPSR